MSLAWRVFRTLYSPKYLLYTNTVTGALFLGSGDIIEQQIVERKLLNHNKQYDPQRTGILFSSYFMSSYISS